MCVSLVVWLDVIHPNKSQSRSGSQAEHGNIGLWFLTRGFYKIGLCSVCVWGVLCVCVCVCQVCYATACVLVCVCVSHSGCCACASVRSARGLRSCFLVDSPTTLKLQRCALRTESLQSESDRNLGKSLLVCQNRCSVRMGKHLAFRGGKEHLAESKELQLQVLGPLQRRLLREVL